MLDFNVFYRLAAAIGIGLIIGLQREHTYYDQSGRHPAGVRTFTLVGLAGAMAALLSDQMGGDAFCYRICCRGHALDGHACVFCDWSL